MTIEHKYITVNESKPLNKDKPQKKRFFLYFMVFIIYLHSLGYKTEKIPETMRKIILNLPQQEKNV